MTSPIDNMRQMRTGRRSHSSRPASCPVSMVHRVQASALGSPPLTFSSHPRRRLQWEEPAPIRNRAMGIHKAHSMAQCLHYHQAYCSTTKTTTSTAINGYNSSSSPHNLLTNQLHNTGSKQALRLRHWPPNSGCHRTLNTTLQAKQDRLARLPPRSQLNTYPDNTSKLRTRNSDSHLHSLILVP